MAPTHKPGVMLYSVRQPAIHTGWQNDIPWTESHFESLPAAVHVATERAATRGPRAVFCSYGHGGPFRPFKLWDSARGWTKRGLKHLGELAARDLDGTGPDRDDHER